MKYYGYCRVSTETQSERGYGLDAQRAEIEKYAAGQDIEITDFYVDAGISGNIKDTDDDDAINKRQGLIDMLAALEDGDAVIILNTSRLWRSDMTKALIRRELIKHNIKVISIEQPRYDLYSKDPNDYLINAIMEALDVHERMSISLKLARGRTTKAKQGAKPAGAVPFGYKYSDDKKSVEVVENEAAAVKLMFSLAQKGASLQKIADAVNDTGARTKRGGSFSKGSVQAILRNDFYTGVLTHAGQKIKGVHEPIISKIQFGRVASQLDQHKRG